MPEFRFPTIDFTFIEEHIRAGGKLENGSIVIFDSYLILTIAGPQNIAKRTTRVTMVEPGQIGFEQAIAISYRFKFFGALLEWLEKTRHWKDGVYFEPQNQKAW
jgi:hypothetical protein